METKFIPGDWVEKQGITVPLHDLDKHIATIFTYRNPTEEQIAIVKLIKSSPKLLDACLCVIELFMAQGINSKSEVGGEILSKLQDAVKDSVE